jgi:hypothetical protein
MTKELKFKLKYLPRGEATLPLLAVVLFALLFVAWPLVDFGLLMRPFPGMVFLIVTLSGLYAFGTHGRALTSILALGGAVFVLQTLALVWDLKAISILNELAAELFVLVLCGVLLSGVMRPGRVTTNRIVGAVVVYVLFALQFAFLFAVLTGGLHSGASVAYVYLDGLALLLSLDDNAQFTGPERHYSDKPLRSIAVDAGGITRPDVYDHLAGAPCLSGSCRPYSKHAITKLGSCTPVYACAAA